MIAFLPIGIFVGFVGLWIWRWIQAVSVAPPEDLRRIKVNFEGIAGSAGPGREVVSIVHTGGYPGSRYSPAHRSYEVVLRKHDNTQEHRTVQIELGLFGQGDMTVGKPRV